MKIKFSSSKNKDHAGFSLIELSILMLIIGLMAATAMESYSAYSSGKALHNTKGRFYDIESALTQFLTKNGRLPCPASLGDTPASATSGIEISSCSTDSTEGTAGTCTGGYCRSPGRDANGNAIPDLVLSGYVPYVTLGLAMKDSVDGWNRKIKYVVTAKLTQNATYNATYGAISVTAANGSNALGAMAAGTGQIALLSQGADGKGAYTIDGNLYAACPATLAGGRDFENCNEPLDATYFSKNERSFVTGADHYDDVVHGTYRIISSSDRWAYLGAPTEMQNTGGRRVGIGTSTPTNQLHVAGNIKASSIRANNFCDYGGVAGYNGPTGINCLPPEVFGGAGISCATGAMNGIKNAASNCATAIVPNSIATGTCPAGKVMCGVSGTGTILCNVSGALTCP